MKGALAPKRYELERNSFMALMSDLRVPFRAGSAPVDRYELPPGGAGVELARPADLVFGVADHLLPLGDPAYGARQREDAGEHRHRDPEGALHDPRIEVHVRVELALDEIIVLERDYFVERKLYPNVDFNSGRACARRNNRPRARFSPA